ncbi:MAG: hydroxymethylglutaryl-CoA lyase [Dehalococcoidia bacterium]|nr:hydroxymethylglutaryl-CoA lyase [Dehalococcoidia bacterium]
MKLPKHATFTEVGPRDGLQTLSQFIPTEKKIALIDSLSETGIEYMEVASFVHPKLVPQMADAAEVVSGIKRRPGTRYLGLVPNAKGAQRAIQYNLDGWGVFVSATESHNRRNLNASIDETLEGFREVVRMAREVNMPVYCAVSMSFGCPYEGDVPPERLVSISGKLQDIGIQRIILGDTTGMGNPSQVEELTGKLLKAYPDMSFSLHFHDTRGAGLANVMAGLLAGATWFEGSVGGLGGCPFAHGASGNTSSEDMIHMLQEMGIETGIDLDRLLSCARLAQEIVGSELPGHLLKAGKRSDLIRTEA